MVDALIVSNLLLWVAVLALAALVLALLRQIGVLHERVAPAGALVGREGPRPGEPAPVLEVDDLSGERLRLGGPDPEGRSTLLFFLSPSCPVCRTLLPVLPSVCAAEDRAVRLVLASDGARAETGPGLAAVPQVLSPEPALAYRVGRLPYAVLIDAQGIVRARGLVNTREHLESLFEARAQGVASLQDYVSARAAAGARG